MAFEQLTLDCFCCASLRIEVDVSRHEGQVICCLGAKPPPGVGEDCPGVWYAQQKTTTISCTAGGTVLETDVTTLTAEEGCVPYTGGSPCTYHEHTDTSFETAPCTSDDESVTVEYLDTMSRDELLTHVGDGSDPIEDTCVVVDASQASWPGWQQGTGVTDCFAAPAIYQDDVGNCDSPPVVGGAWLHLKFRRIGAAVPVRIWWLETTILTIDGTVLTRTPNHVDINSDEDSVEIDIHPSSAGVTVNTDSTLVYAPYLDQPDPVFLHATHSITHPMMATALSAAPRDPIAAQGRACWDALHEMAWYYPSEPTAETVQAAREWLAAFEQRIPSYGCKCRNAWRKIIAKVPPPLEQGREALYWWTIAAHDVINRKLGKPLHHPDFSLSHPLFS